MTRSRRSAALKWPYIQKAVHNKQERTHEKRALEFYAPVHIEMCVCVRVFIRSNSLHTHFDDDRRWCTPAISIMHTGPRTKRMNIHEHTRSRSRSLARVRDARRCPRTLRTQRKQFNSEKWLSNTILCVNLATQMFWRGARALALARLHSGRRMRGPIWSMGHSNWNESFLNICLSADIITCVFKWIYKHVNYKNQSHRYILCLNIAISNTISSLY